MSQSDRRRFLLLMGVGFAVPAWLRAAPTYAVHYTEAEWRLRLTPAQFAILRQKATERPYTSPLLKEHRKGVFACAADGNALFETRTKFDSGTGWPSFWAPLPGAVGTSIDHDIGEARTEVHCARCGGHLGHVFDDGPPPTGKRYCMNGAAMVFRPA
ncbi:MAG TPA: peptide-methionine (R)-S-oxide reductase MsrB [Novosphingobium sp.]|nr:peptide-methionine (R)-S-oxide reductase MsrB [Novosphingobium sp.]